jgi:hypothetical protein
MKLVRFLLALLVVTTACSGTSSSTGTGPDAGPPPPQPQTDAFTVQTSMRALWEEHVFWTRIYIIDAVSALPKAETDATAQRLLQNQTDIGNAIRPFYGDAAADQLTSLLMEHIQGAVAVISAAMAHDDAALKTANDAWYANGYAIAQFLAAANPHWDSATTQTHMKRHLDLTLAEAVARLSAQYDAEVTAYDAVVNHILTFSDFLSSGVTAQFPAQVGASPLTAGDASLHLGMRKLWEDHVQWTRIYIVDQTANLPDTPNAAARLLQNQVDIGDAVKPFYGAAAGDQLTALLKTHITGAVALIDAVESGDQNAITQANTAWYANGDDIAHFLASANPNWSLGDLQYHMKLHLDQTLAEVSAHLKSDWNGDIAAYDAVAAHIRVMADFLSNGIAKQFPGSVQ